jgi:hypothetical protein
VQASLKFGYSFLEAELAAAVSPAGGGINMGDSAYVICKPPPETGAGERRNT